MATASQLAVGLQLGTINATEVQTWVDSQFEGDAEISDEIIDLAYSGSDSIKMMEALNKMPLEPGNFWDDVKHCLVQAKSKDLARLEFCIELMKKLYEAALKRSDVPVEMAEQIRYLENSLDLAEEGVLGTPDSWHTEFKSFVGGLSAGV